MKHRPSKSTALAVALLLLAPACTFHSTTSQLSGVDGIRGEPIEYQTSTSWALYALFIFPLLGSATPNYAVEQFAQEAASRGATRMRIVDTNSTTYWLIFPPLSFFFHPVATSVEGELEGTVVE